MNRRDALAVLMGLPAIASIQVATLQPDDVIVVETDEHLSLSGTLNLSTKLQQIWPGRPIVVLDRGMQLKFARAPGPPPRLGMVGDVT